VVSEEVFQCPGCDREYKTERNFMKHVEQHHPELLGKEPERPELMTDMDKLVYAVDQTIQGVNTLTQRQSNFEATVKQELVNLKQEIGTRMEPGESSILKLTQDDQWGPLIRESIGAVTTAIRGGGGDSARYLDVLDEEAKAAAKKIILNRAKITEGVVKALESGRVKIDPE